MRASHLALLCLLGVVCTDAAPPEWTCSPPNVQNPFCPAKYQGNIKCNSEFCQPYAGCTTKDCNAIQGNIEADQVLALDAYVVKGDRCVLSTVSAPECCNLCKITEGCNAWSYCNEKEGCGSGCSEEVHGFNAALLSKLGSDIGISDSPNRLNPAHQCTAAGAWPYGMCSLKVVAPDNVQMTPGNQDGWISGVPTAGAPAWHEQTSEQTSVLTPARALPRDATATTQLDSDVLADSQVGTDAPQDPAAAAAAAPAETPSARFPAADEEHDYEVLSYESTAVANGHTSSDTPGHTIGDAAGHTMTETPEGTLITVAQGQQFPEGDLQYVNYENAPMKPGAITGPQDVQYYSATPSPSPSPGPAAAAAAPTQSAAGNAAGTICSSRLSLLIAGVLAVLALFC